MKKLDYGFVWRLWVKGLKTLWFLYKRRGRLVFMHAPAIEKRFWISVFKIVSILDYLHFLGFVDRKMSKYVWEYEYKITNFFVERLRYLFFKLIFDIILFFLEKSYL